MFNIRSRQHDAGQSHRSVRGLRTASVAALAALSLAAAGHAQTDAPQDTGSQTAQSAPQTAQSAPKLPTVSADAFKPPTPVTYTQRYEIYGGFSFLNGQAGQVLPKRYNMGGGEGMFTYWVTPKWGAAGDVRWEAGTTPVQPAGQLINVQTRPLVYQAIGMGGAQYHWWGNQRAGINLHALGGVTHGIFDHDRPKNVDENTFYADTGLYSNRSAFMGTVGGSVDFNTSAKLAIRLAPELVFEHFGTELREFFSVSGGVVYRFGNR